MIWRDCRLQLRIYMPFACGMCYFRPFAHSSYILYSFFAMFHVPCYMCFCFCSASLAAHGFRPSQIQRNHENTRAYIHKRHLPWNGCRITVRITIKFAFITFKCSNKLFGRALVCLVFVSLPFHMRSMLFSHSLSPSHSFPLFCYFRFRLSFVVFHFSPFLKTMR